jgi:hypothetical protein
VANGTGSDNSGSADAEVVRAALAQFDSDFAAEPLAALTRLQERAEKAEADRDESQEDLGREHGLWLSTLARAERAEAERDAALHNALHPHHGCRCTDEATSRAEDRVKKLEAALREAVRAIEAEKPRIRLDVERGLVNADSWDEVANAYGDVFI